MHLVLGVWEVVKQLTFLFVISFDRREVPKFEMGIFTDMLVKSFVDINIASSNIGYVESIICSFATKSITANSVGIDGTIY